MIITYYVSLMSPYAYLGAERFLQIAGNYNAIIKYKPTNMKIVFPKTGGLPLAKRSSARKNYRLTELRRWSNYSKIPLNLNPKHYPTSEWPAAGIIMHLQSKGLEPGRLLNKFLRAVWVEDRNIGDFNTILEIVNEAGLDGDGLLKSGQNINLKKEWGKNSLDAIKNGVFGVPSYLFDNELFWGQDRLNFLEYALSKASTITNEKLKNEPL